MTISANEVKYVKLYSSLSLNSYKKECFGSYFYVSNQPDFISIDYSNYNMVVKAPNLVGRIGIYHFYVNDWLVSVEVVAPCASNNI